MTIVIIRELEKTKLYINFSNVDYVEVIDKDGGCADTLRLVMPNIFAKGGDRIPSNMPQKEVDVCREIGCDIVYGVGDQLNSSSKLVKEMSKGDVQ